MPVKEKRRGSKVLPSEEESQSLVDLEAQYCHACGKGVPWNAVFCPSCGRQQRRQKSSWMRESSPSIAKAGRRCTCPCSCCAAVSILVSALLILVLCFLDHLIKMVVEGIGPKLTGTDVSMRHLHLGLLDGRVEMHSLVVSSPPGYEDDLMRLGKLVFAVDPRSVLRAWLSGFSQPVILEEFSLVGLQVSIDMNGFPVGDSNAQVVVDHMSKAVKQMQDASEAVQQADPALPTLPPVPKPPHADADGPGAFSWLTKAKVKSKKLEISDVSSHVRIMTMSPVTFMLDRVEIADVGTKHHGVHVYEFVDMLVRAVLMAVLRGAPRSIQANLAGAFGQELWQKMNFPLSVDLGQGLEQIGSGWDRVGEAAQLPRIATEGARLTAQAAELGVKINREVIRAGTKINSDLVGAGAELTGVGIAASNMLTSTQAAERTARVGAAFTKGLASTLR